MANADSARNAVDAARAAGDRIIEAEALGLVGYSAAFRREPAEGLAPASEAIAIARSLDDPALLAETLNYYGAPVAEAGDLIRAEAIYQEALSVVDRVGDVFIAQGLLCNYGNVLLNGGKVVEARHVWERALELNSSPGLSATILSNLGYIALEQGDGMRAQSNLVRALREHRLRGGRRDSAYDILGLAICASDSGDARLAATLHGGASALIHSTGAEWESGLDRYRDPDITALRTQLGDRFQICYDAGLAMSTDEIVDLALGRLIRFSAESFE